MIIKKRKEIRRLNNYYINKSDKDCLHILIIKSTF